MRFRYIDSKGKEITLDSVEALAARIELGAVESDTELFDASTDTWGPADSHQVFRQLLAEAAARDFGTPGDVAPAPVPVFGVELPAPPSPVADHPALVPVETGPPSHEADASPPLDPSTEGLTLTPNLRESVAEALAGVGGAEEETPLEEGGTDLAAGEDDSGSFDLGIDGNLEVEAYDPAEFNDTAVDRQPPIEGFTASAGGGWETANDTWDPAGMTEPESEESPEDAPVAASPSLEMDEAWGVADEHHPFDDPADLDDVAAANGGWPAEALLEDGQVVPRKTNRLIDLLSAPVLQWGFLSAAFLVMALFGSSVGHGFLLRAFLTVGGVSFVALATGFLLWSDPERRTLIPAATFGLITMISVPLFLVGSKTQAHASPAVESMTSDRSAGGAGRPTALPAANPGEVAMENRALELVVDGMDSLAVAYGLDRRPADWLHGVYLANASQYESVETYWNNYATYLDEVRSQDVDWFRDSYQTRLLAAGIQPEAVAGLVERGVERFRAAAPRREALYDTMADLAQSSLRLHALLLEHEDDIDYQPFQQSGISEDPVVEAVPNTPELEDEMWSLIARVALSLESISDLGQTSPANLQAALVDSVRASVR